MKNTLKNKSNAKLKQYLNKTDSIRKKVEKETNKFIELLKANQMELFNEVSEIEKYIEKKLNQENEEEEEALMLTNKKRSIENNSISEKELVQTLEESNVLKSKISDLEKQLEEFTENIEFSTYKSVSSKDGLIGEIQTNEKV